jgi:hypothetical protein
MNFEVSLKDMLPLTLPAIEQREANTAKRANKKQKVVQATATTTDANTDPF